jgi:putative membrane protein
MVSKLRDEKAGMDFDKKYLDQMVDVNDKAINKAKSLVDNSQDASLKSYVEKIMRDDQTHMDKAKKLKEMVK